MVLFSTAVFAAVTTTSLLPVTFTLNSLLFKVNTFCSRGLKYLYSNLLKEMIPGFKKDTVVAEITVSFYLGRVHSVKIIVF